MSRINLGVEQVLALSPDEASTKAARGLLAPSRWPLLGAHDAAVWGECQGSGSKPYQTQVDVSGAALSFRCSCPSRKFPCKHGLALLLLQAQDASRFTAAEPLWVAQWLAARKERVEKQEAKAATPPPSVDPVASAKREAQRWARMAQGAQELALWLDDLSRKGLATLTGAADESWNKMAARMVDAQAPGLGQRLLQAAAVVGRGADWPARLLVHLGGLQLLVDAVAQVPRLPEALQSDLRQAMGWPIERDAVLASGARVCDTWQVLAQVQLEREARLHERRVWLQGRNSQRMALLLDFAYAGKAFEHSWSVGAEVAATLAFYPGTDPLRAILVDTAPATARAAPTGGAAMEQPWHVLAARMAANPWAMGWPLCLEPVVLQYGTTAQPWFLRWQDRAQDRAIVLCMESDDAWRLLALSGGMPLRVFGEWDGECLRPLTAWFADGATLLWGASTMLVQVGEGA